MQYFSYANHFHTRHLCSYANLAGYFLPQSTQRFTQGAQGGYAADWFSSSSIIYEPQHPRVAMLAGDADAKEWINLYIQI